MAHILLIGVGYTAKALLQSGELDGWTVRGTCRSPEKARELETAGVEPVLWASPDPLPSDCLVQSDAIMVSVGPSRTGPPGPCPVAAAWPAEVSFAGKQIIYLSATGVYGDHGGDWVDEDTKTSPSTDRGHRRLAAEESWRALVLRTGGRLTCFRLSGIYGPARNAVDTLRGGTPGAKKGYQQRIIKPGQVFNRVHVADIAAGVGRLLQAETAPSVLNATDEAPAPPQDVISFAAELLGMPPPPEVPFEDAQLSPMGRSFYADNKRLRADRFRDLLGGSLLYPTYREGLRAIFEASS